MKLVTLPAIAISMLAFANIAQAQNAAKLFISGDMIRGNQAGAPGPGCVLNGQFKHLEKVVFRIRVLDASGAALDAKGLKSVVVELPDGQKMNAKYGKHPGGPNPGTDNFWTAIWIIPTGYPTGTFAYKVTATDQQDQSLTWEPFKVAASELQVMAGDIEIKKP
jgi:hypothetical protein